MNETDLMCLVQPAEGWFAIVGIKDGSVKQELVETREEADEVISRFIEQQRNVFFGVAKFRDGSKRTKENVLALQSFWLDLDCGELKAEIDEATGIPGGYIDQPTALAALREFAKFVGLPKPAVVNSGRGLHVYWPLTEPVSREEWEPVAERLKELCRKHSFYADPACFEAARILRVPDTLNFKGDIPLPVELIATGEPIPFDEFCDLLGVKVVPKDSPEWEPSERTKALQRNTGYSFKRIMQRSAAGEGCNQLLHAYINRESLSYYEWFYALSVAAMCDDAEEATHKLSSGYPDYDMDNVDKKVATIKMATSCSKFKAANPELCEGCPHAGRILGPKELGKIARVVHEAPVTIVDTSPQTGKPTEYTIPKYPYPYYRGDGGGVWRHPPKVPGAEEADPIMVYEHDFYVVKRMEDLGDGDMIVFRLHLPMDGIREFVVAQSKVFDKAELRKALSAKGVASDDDQFKRIYSYIVTTVKEIQYQRRAEIMRQQFGWAENNTKFVIGAQEISIDGVSYSPPSSTTSKLSKFLGPVGSLDRWKEVWALYGKEGLEPHAFAALSAFGAPLLAFLNQTGAAINLFNSKSGTGKTTVLNMINSVYGHPKDLRLKKDDTLNGKLQWLGILNNLPCTMDEVTNMKPEDFSDLLYALSNGKGKERMVSGSNELRINNTTWQTITICTSNASFNEKLSILKQHPEGELMRLIEYEIAPTDMIPTDVGKNMFDDVLFHNFGHAGPIFIEYVIGHMEEVIQSCAEVQAKLDRELQLEPKERFWSATVAANIVGGLVARRCKLIDWNMGRIYGWISGYINKMRHEVLPPMETVDQVVGEFVYRHMQNILVVNDSVDMRATVAEVPKREPKGELLIRIEPDTKRMFIVAKAFKQDCVRYQINYRETLRKLQEGGRFLKRDQKRMSKGTSVASLPVPVLVFDLSSDDFISVDDYIAPTPATVGEMFDASSWD